MNTPNFPNFEKRGGLLIAIIQDAKTKEVLMHGFMNPEALEKTLQTGEFWRWSTSKNRLMRKGEESGNIMKVKEWHRDCDGDAILLLVKVIGDGNACHLKRHSCFVPLDLTKVIY